MMLSIARPPGIHPARGSVTDPIGRGLPLEAVVSP
jgi:hypothetical protein